MVKKLFKIVVPTALSLILVIGSAVPVAAAGPTTDTKTSVMTYELIVPTDTQPDELMDVPINMEKAVPVSEDLSDILYYPERSDHITVYANGSEVVFDDVNPIPADWAYGYSKPYLPLRDLMEALGATVDYSLDDRMIFVAFGDTTVSFPIYSSTATVTDAKTGESHSYDMTPSPRYINGRVLITPDMLSDCFGLLTSSSWSSVSVIDLEAMMEGFDDHFKVMNKMLAVSNAQRNYKYDGTYEGKIDLNLPQLTAGSSYLMGAPQPAGAPKSGISIPFEGIFTSENSSTISAGDFALRMNLDEVDKLLQYYGVSASMLPLSVSALSDFSISYIFDVEKYVVFIKCPLLTKYVLGMPTADWVKIDMNKAGMYDSMLSPYTTDLSFSQLIDLVIRMQAQSGYYDYNTVTSLLKTIEVLFSDASFTKTGSDAAPVYNLTISKNDLIDNIVKLSEAFGETLTREEVAEEIDDSFGEFDFDLKLSIAFKNDDSYAVGIDFHAKLVDADDTLMQIDITGDENFPGKSEIEMVIKYSQDSYAFALTLKINSTSALTNTSPSPEPPPGDKVMDLSELY